MSLNTNNEKEINVIGLLRLLFIAIIGCSGACESWQARLSDLLIEGAMMIFWWPVWKCQTPGYLETWV
jgi:hypothetical protein